MNVYRKNFFKNLGISEDKYNFIAKHISDYDDEISREYIKSKRLSPRTVSQIDVEKIIYRLGFEEFLKDFKMYLWSVEIPSLRKLEDRVLKERVKSSLFYYLETEVRLVVSILHNKGMDDIIQLEKENNMEHTKTWYDLYHDELGFLNKDNKMDFLYKIKNKDIREEVDLFYRFFQREEVLFLFHKFNRYSPAEINALYLDNSNLNDILEIYYHFIETLMDKGSGIHIKEIEEIVKEDYLKNNKIKQILSGGRNGY